MLYLDLEDLKESKSKGERERSNKKEGTKKSYSLHKKPIGCISPPGAESDFWPTMLHREQGSYQKSDTGENHYYVCCLGQAHVSLHEYSSVIALI